MSTAFIIFVPVKKRDSFFCPLFFLGYEREERRCNEGHEADDPRGGDVGEAAAAEGESVPLCGGGHGRPRLPPLHRPRPRPRQPVCRS